MVFLKYSKRRKKYVRRKRPYKKKPSIGRSLVIGGFPKSQMVKLRYCEEFVLDPGPGLVGIQVFSANGIHDPNITGGGHQPSNHDVWMARYDHYTVIGSKINVNQMPSSTSNLAPGYQGVLVSDDGSRVSGISSLQYLLEQPNIATSGSLSVVGAISTKSRPTRAYFSASKFFGKSKSAVLGDDQYRGSVSTNPNDQAYYEFFLWSVSGNNPAGMSFMATIEYTVVYSERKPALTS